jgi:hypothetical protein
LDHAFRRTSPAYGRSRRGRCLVQDASVRSL